MVKVTYEVYALQRHQVYVGRKLKLIVFNGCWSHLHMIKVTIPAKFEQLDAE